MGLQLISVAIFVKQKNNESELKHKTFEDTRIKKCKIHTLSFTVANHKCPAGNEVIRSGEKMYKNRHNDERRHKIRITNVQ